MFSLVTVTQSSCFPGRERGGLHVFVQSRRHPLCRCCHSVDVVLLWSSLKTPFTSSVETIVLDDGNSRYPIFPTRSNHNLVICALLKDLHHYLLTVPYKKYSKKKIMSVVVSWPLSRLCHTSDCVTRHQDFYIPLCESLFTSSFYKQNLNNKDYLVYLLPLSWKFLCPDPGNKWMKSRVSGPTPGLWNRDLSWSCPRGLKVYVDPIQGNQWQRSTGDILVLSGMGFQQVEV
jgi:hypothetical protein